MSFAQLLAVQPGTLHDLADAWRVFGDRARGHAGDLRQAVAPIPRAWVGDAADEASRHTAELAKRIDEGAGRVAPIQGVLHDAADRIAAAQRQLRAALGDAAAHHVHVLPDGRLYLPATRGQPPAEYLAAVARVRQGIAAAVQAATTADGDLAAALRGSYPAAELARSGAGSRAPAPSTGTPPAQVKRWWDGLCAAEREAQIQQNAERIGNLDGIPAQARDRANRINLARGEADLIEQQHQLEAKGAARSARENDLLGDVTGKLTGIHDIQARLVAHQPDVPPAMLLGFDTRNRGHAIVALGNPDTAAHVATYVPGMTNELSTMDVGISRSEAMLRSAVQAGASSTAVIAWYGYDMPHSVVDAASLDAATAGAPTLHDFQDGLRVTHEGAASHNTVVAHSYGSTLAGMTAHGPGLAVDDLAVVGSSGTTVGHARDLHVPDGHVWAGVAAMDPLAGPWHGLGPTSPLYGAHTFDAGLGGTPWDAHSSYWDSGSASLTNLGRIVAGDYQKVT